jgi:hypothetical protein
MFCHFSCYVIFQWTPNELGTSMHAQQLSLLDTVIYVTLVHEMMEEGAFLFQVYYNDMLFYLWSE